MGTGVGSALAWRLLGAEAATGIGAVIPSIGISCLMLIGVSLLTRAGARARVGREGESSLPEEEI